MAQLSLRDFDFILPEELIAKTPSAVRPASRLMVVKQGTLPESPTISHHVFKDLLSLLLPGDLLVFNDTKVIPARLSGQKATGGKVSCLVERVLSANSALVHIKSSHAPKVGAKLLFESVLQATVIARHDALFELVFDDCTDLEGMLEQYGTIPLPPYMNREAGDDDKERYQTVYAKYPGAVAAPTAGLHFDQALLLSLKKQGVDLGYLTLHVGAGTFQPVRTDTIEAHRMHSERFHLSPELCEQINATKARGGRVVAVGTTVVRALESAASEHGIAPTSGDTDIFIRPGYRFQVIDLMITNFHLPKSTLLMLVAAFVGHAQMMRVYQVAIENAYRFYSYGDAMLLYPSLAS